MADTVNESDDTGSAWSSKFVWAPPPAPPGRPATAGYGGYPVPVRQAPRLRATATIAQLVLVLTLVADALLIWALTSRLSLIDRIVAHPGTISLSEARSSDDRVSTFATIQLISVICCAVGWLVWFYQARLAAEAYSNDDVRFGTGWAIGAWFVPFLNLMRPYKMTGDILDAVRRPAGSFESDGPGRVLLGFWWAFFIAGTITVRVISTDESSVSSIRHASVTLIVALALTIVAAVLAVLLVQRITTASDRRQGR